MTLLHSTFYLPPGAYWICLCHSCHTRSPHILKCVIKSPSWLALTESLNMFGKTRSCFKWLHVSRGGRWQMHVWMGSWNHSRIAWQAELISTVPSLIADKLHHLQGMVFAHIKFSEKSDSVDLANPTPHLILPLHCCSIKLRKDVTGFEGLVSWR